MKSKIAALMAALALGVGGMSAVAHAEGDPPVPCDQPTITVVVEEAWTEVIEHEAVTETIHHEAVTERVWHTWTGGPVEGAPPVDSEHWNPTEGAPNGGPHDQPDGVPYQTGGGNSPWFLWLTVVVEEAYDEVVVVEEAYTETIEHPEVTEEQTNPAYPCDEEEPGEEPCPDDTLVFNPETGECDSTEEEPEEPNETVCEATPSLCEYPTETEEPEVKEPQVKDPQTDQVRPEGPVYPTQTDPVCVAGAMVVKVLDASGNVIRSTTVNGHSDCAQATKTGQPFEEEGF